MSACPRFEGQTDCNIISGMVAGLWVKGWKGATNKTKFHLPIAPTKANFPGHLNTWEPKTGLRKAMVASKSSPSVVCWPRRAAHGQRPLIGALLEIA